jgi:hypothetical protein
VAIPHSPANFCLIVIKPYYTEKVPENKQHYDNQPEENNEPTAKTAKLTTRNKQVQYHSQGQLPR